METIILAAPSIEYEAQIKEYIDAFIVNGDNPAGTAGLENVESIDAWLQALDDNAKEETVRDGLVPASAYLALRVSDNTLVGMVHIRHRLNDWLLQFGGHIGYSVRKSERRKGYATEMLRLALEKCRQMQIKSVLITCDQDNTASAKTIMNNGGVLENEVLEGDTIKQRYWVEVE